MDSGDNDAGNYDEPLWRYVNILELKGGSARFRCNYCNRAFLGSYSAVEAHLLRACEGMTPSFRAQLWNEFLASKNANARTMPKSVSLPYSPASGYSVGVPDTGKAMIQSKKRKKNTDVEEEDYLMEIRDHLDAIIARIFYSSGLSFNVARNPHFQSSYSLATRKNDIFYFTDVEIRGHLDAIIARMFYSSGLPFHVARNPFLRSSFSNYCLVGPHSWLCTSWAQAAEDNSFTTRKDSH